jgi:hypothetical protein
VNQGAEVRLGEVTPLDDFDEFENESKSSMILRLFPGQAKELKLASVNPADLKGLPYHTKEKRYALR